MKAAIYCRVSTEDQEKEGTSLQTQLEACLKYCQDKGYDVAYRFSETYSGLTLERPKLNERRELVRAGAIDVIVCYCLDRLSRDPVHGVIIIEELEKHHVILEAVTETVDSSEVGKLISYIRGFASKLEASKIRERIMRGKKARAANGKIPGNVAKHFGYYYVPGKGEGEGIRYINEDEAKWIRKWKDWLLYEDVGLKEITRRMRSLGIATCSEKGTWQRSTIRGILTNPTIAGTTYAFTYAYEDSKTEGNRAGKRRRKLVRKPREDWVEIPEATPAIISKAEFDAIQQKLAQNRSNPRRKAIGLYWLQGHVVCGLCGRRYRAKSQLVKSKSNPHYVYYYECPCLDRMVSPDKCSNRRWNRDKLQDLVWRQIRALLLNPEAVLAGVKAVQDDASQAEYYRQELHDVETGLRRLDEEQWNLLQQAKRGFPEEMVEADNKRINESRASLMQRKADLEDKIARASQAANNMASIEKFCELARRNIDDLTDEDRKLAAKALDVKVHVYPDRINIEGIIPILDDIPSDYLTSKSSATG
jgi:site-specific DNA recombinase